MWLKGPRGSCALGFAPVVLPWEDRELGCCKGCTRDFYQSFLSSDSARANKKCSQFSTSPANVPIVIRSWEKAQEKENQCFNSCAVTLTGGFTNNECNLGRPKSKGIWPLQARKPSRNACTSALLLQHACMPDTSCVLIVALHCVNLLFFQPSVGVVLLLLASLKPTQKGVPPKLTHPEFTPEPLTKWPESWKKDFGYESIFHGPHPPGMQESFVPENPPPLSPDPQLCRRCSSQPQTGPGSADLGHLRVFVLHPGITALGNDPEWFQTTQFNPEMGRNGVNTQWVYSQGVIQKPLDTKKPPICHV